MTDLHSLRVELLQVAPAEGRLGLHQGALGTRDQTLKRLQRGEDDGVVLQIAHRGENTWSSYFTVEKHNTCVK